MESQRMKTSVTPLRSPKPLKVVKTRLKCCTAQEYKTETINYFVKNYKLNYVKRKN